MKLSVTILSSYLYCPRKLFLERVLGFREAPKEAMVIGSIRHQVLEIMNKRQEDIVRQVKEGEVREVIERYSAEYCKALRESIVKNKGRLRQVDVSLSKAFEKNLQFCLGESRAMADNVICFVNKHKVYGDELWERLTPKIKCEYALSSDKLGLNGRIDHLEVYDDRIVPVEIKTGKMPKQGVWDGHRVQIVAYALMLEEKFGIEIKEGVIRYVDNKEERKVVLNHFMRKEVLDIIAKTKNLLTNTETPGFNAVKGKCEVCGLREICYNESVVKQKIREITK